MTATEFKIGDTLVMHPSGGRTIAYQWNHQLWSAVFVNGLLVQRHPDQGWGVYNYADGFIRQLRRQELRILPEIAPGPEHPPLIPFQEGLFDPDSIPQESPEILRAELIRSRLLSSDQIDQLQDPGWLIDRYVPAGGLTTVFGKPGSFKTFLVLDWACCVASGTWWKGHKVRQGPVIYVMAEGSAGLRKRKKAWEASNGVRLAEFPIHWYPQPINLLDAEWSAPLAFVAGELSARLVVIDTVARAMPGGDENNGKDMGALIAAADRIRAATGGAVLLVHHTPHDGGRLRGHSSLEGAVDTNIGVESDGTTIKVTIEKQKDAEPAEPLLLHPEPINESVVLRPGSTGDPSPLPPSTLDVLKTIDEIDLGAGVTNSQIVGANKAVAPRTLQRRLKDFLRNDYCHTVSGNPGERGARYALTDLGKEAINR